MHHTATNHLQVMFVIMVLSGFLTTMNVWADSINDIRFSLNDLYMTLLMTGWMFIFMGLFYKQHKTFLIGILLAIVNFWCIRSQFMISQQQYILGMIPHHSMAVHMSKKVLENNDLNNNKKLKSFVENIISNQAKEIVELKNNA